ncbi:MAG: GNAT family N-acetyltransferase [Ktedonobacterales bacterium]
MTTLTPRPFVSPTDLPAILTLVQQSATAETLFDVPRYSDLASWLAPVGVVANASREDEGYRHQMIQQATTLWETESGEAVAYAVIPFTTSLNFAILPQWRSTELMQSILTWGLARLREQCRAPFLMTRCHEDDVDLQAALTQKGFEPEPYQDVYLARPLDTVPAAPALPKGFRLQAGVTVAEYAAYQGLHQAIYGHGMGMDEHFSSTYQPELDLIAIAPDDTWAAVCFCTMDQVADADHIERVGDVGLLGVHPGFRRLGLGRALLLTAMQRAHEQGAAYVVLETENVALPAMRLYRSVAFQPGSPWRWWKHDV